MSPYIAIFLAVLLIIPGWLIHKYKWYWLISGYTTMPESRRRNIDWNGFSLFMRNMFIIAGASLILGWYILYCTDRYYESHYGIVILVVILLTVALTIIIGNKRFNYEKKGGLPKHLETYLEPQRTKFIIPVIIIGILIPLLVTVTGLKQPKIFILEKKLVVKDFMYGFELPYNEVVKIDTLSELPDIQYKSNGFDFGSTMKGYFNLKEIGVAKLLIVSNNSPYINIQLKNNQTIYLNTKSEQETIKLYKSIKEKIN